ncbi:MAG: L-rhamnose mutarotase [bacterium]|nr:L-rhamnose mutarotase [bacterium]
MYSSGMTFKLKPGNYEAYKKAHDELWPEMVEAMSKNEVNMVIYHYNDRLFLYLTAPSREHFERSHRGEVADRWTAYMATMMETDENGNSIVEELDQAFAFGDFKTV